MENNLKRGIGVKFLLSAIILGLIGSKITEQNFHRLFMCFAFSVFGLGLRALFYGEAPKETEISYGYYFVALIAISSSIFLGLHKTMTELPRAFFYFLSFTLFTSMGFIVRTVLGGLIK